MLSQLIHGISASTPKSSLELYRDGVLSGAGGKIVYDNDVAIGNHGK